MSNDYDVGYGKPPKSTQFKPGKSGNPKGRPKGTRNLRSDLQEELNAKVTVIEAGNQIQVSRQKALIKSMMAKAIKGDTSAARVLINLIVGIEQADAERSIVVTTTAEDLEVLQGYKDRLLEEIDAKQEDES